MSKINEAVGMKNCVTMNGGDKRLVLTFKRRELWKFIGCIISAVTYGKKGHNIWSEIPKPFGKMENPKLRIAFHGNTNLYRVCCAHYHHFYIYTCHSTILSYTTLFISWMFL